jgi:hypothetical protein
METMLTAEASVATERSSRYLVQLCRHLDHAARMHPQLQANAEWSEDRGVITFGFGRCVLHAERDALTLRAEATDTESLLRIEQRVADRLAQIGRRDGLTVTWSAPPQGDARARTAATVDNERTSA